MNVPRGGRQLFASLDASRQSSANLARIWGAAPTAPEPRAVVLRVVA